MPLGTLGLGVTILDKSAVTVIHGKLFSGEGAILSKLGYKLSMRRFHFCGRGWECQTVPVNSINVHLRIQCYIKKYYENYDRICCAVVHRDCSVTITVYLHRTPAYPSPWKRACYIMITVDCGSTSIIYNSTNQAPNSIIRVYYT